MPTHYDVFLSYHWRDQTPVHALAEKLRNQNLHVFLDRWYLTPGQPWPELLEQALATCGAVAVCIGPGEMGSWQQREQHYALDRQSREKGFPVIPVLMPGAEPPLGFIRQNTWVDFRTGLSDDLPLQLLAAAVRREPPDALLRERQLETLATICPYRGLQFFREEDAAFLFGRDAAIETLYKALQQRPFIALVGPSGSGKSSVVRAGLCPKLRQERLAPWEIATLVPGGRPFHHLAGVLLPLLQTDLREVDLLDETAKLAQKLADGAIELRDVIQRILEKQAGTQRFLLVVDQWEELYTHGRVAYKCRFFSPSASRPANCQSRAVDFRQTRPSLR
ncbi:MAG: TIR domain-containing protein, partial [Candidatus Methylumidiphilus sp.]